MSIVFMTIDKKHFEGGNINLLALLMMEPFDNALALS
jgi:hypothetical protein